MMKFIALALGLLSVVFNLSANSAIIDSRAFAHDSFIDTNTGLVWMDYGINNGQSYNHVTTQLANGGDYFGRFTPYCDQRSLFQM